MMTDAEKLKYIRRVIEKHISEVADAFSTEVNIEMKQHQIGMISGLIRCWNLFDEEDLAIAICKHGVEEDE